MCDELQCRTNWENYYMEITMIIGIIVYFLNFFTGKTKNQKIANQVKYKALVLPFTHLSFMLLKSFKSILIL